MSFNFVPPKTTAAPAFSFGTPTTGPNTGQSFGAGDSTHKVATPSGITFGSASAPMVSSLLGGLGTTTPTSSTGFTLGGTTIAPAGTNALNLSGNLTGFGSPKVAVAQGSATGFAAFGTPKTTVGTGFSLLGAPPATVGIAPTLAPTLAPVSNIASSGFSLGSSAAISAPALSTGFSLGTPATSSITSTTATTAAPGFPLSGAASLSITKTTTAAQAPISGFSLSSSTAQTGGLSILPPASTIANLPATLSSATVTTNAALAPGTSTNFGQLEESINKWTLELEEQEKVFMNQATQVNAWDRMLIENGDKIVTLNESVEQIKQEQKALEHELDFIISQQVELEEMISPLEVELANVNIRDPEREMTYQLAENLDTQFKQMSEDLKEVIEHLNETNRSQDASDPVVQIGRILNAHMSSLQWVDSSTSQISTQLQQINKMQETLRHNTERAFHRTFE